MLAVVSLLVVLIVIARALIMSPLFTCLYVLFHVCVERVVGYLLLLLLVCA